MAKTFETIRVETADGVARIVETNLRLIEIIAAFFAGPDKPVYFVFAALPFHHICP